ncbi:MAG TPA: hypothetical protein VIF62_06490, partial [Labilithrix sp.]
MRGASILVLVMVAFVALSACPAPAPVGPPPPPPPPIAAVPPAPPARADGRLPALATPVSVELAMDVDPTKTTFRGTERIVVDVPAETWHVVMHSHALAIADARALLPSGEAVAARTSARPANGDKGDAPEELVITFARPLPPGRSTIALAWSGPFDGELRGLYRVQDHDAWYAFTQFEAVSARRAFPSFDEPSFKVPWTVSVTAPKGMIAVANGPEIERRDAGATTTFRFAPTPPMPSYLVALAVGPFDAVPIAGLSVPGRVITVKGGKARAAMAAEM